MIETVDALIELQLNHRMGHFEYNVALQQALGVSFDFFYASQPVLDRLTSPLRVATTIDEPEKFLDVMGEKQLPFVSAKFKAVLEAFPLIGVEFLPVDFVLGRYAAPGCQGRIVSGSYWAMNSCNWLDIVDVENTVASWIIPGKPPQEPGDFVPIDSRRQLDRWHKVVLKVPRILEAVFRIPHLPNDVFISLDVLNALRQHDLSGWNIGITDLDYETPKGAKAVYYGTNESIIG